jgi:hypothetical protein
VIDHYSWDARLAVLDDIVGLRGRNDRRLDRPAAA